MEEHFRPRARQQVQRAVGVLRLHHHCIEITPAYNNFYINITFSENGSKTKDPYGKRKAQQKHHAERQRCKDPATSGGEVPRGALAPGSVRLRRLWISHLSDHPEHQDGNVIQRPHRLSPHPLIRPEAARHPTYLPNTSRRPGGPDGSVSIREGLRDEWTTPLPPSIFSITCLQSSRPWR